MGQWDPPFNCSSGDFIFCCGTCGFRFCCTFKKRRLNQSTCTNYDTPLWLNTGKPPARKDDPLHDPTKDKTNLIVYIICGVVAVMVLVGIFTKLGLEKAHRPQREHMSRALADVMRPQGHCNTDHMERDLNIVVHVQHYENMDTRTPINNLHLAELLEVGICIPSSCNFHLHNDGHSGASQAKGWVDTQEAVPTAFTVLLELWFVPMSLVMPIA
ncbi:Protein shisa-9 [Myotis brandtii]|uniref:Protein shisa-9 n=1 Tax=Myotis brandtii TaxID=109478 RepID=S7MI18_MYOBR|nr:Protein shisa-9 [Myotis brandtii]